EGSSGRDGPARDRPPWSLPVRSSVLEGSAEARLERRYSNGRPRITLAAIVDAHLAPEPDQARDTSPARQSETQRPGHVETAKVAPILVDHDERNAVGTDDDAGRSTGGHHLVSAVRDDEGETFTARVEEVESRVAAKRAGRAGSVPQHERERILSRLRR